MITGYLTLLAPWEALKVTALGASGRTNQIIDSFRSLESQEN